MLFRQDSNLTNRIKFGVAVRREEMSLSIVPAAVANSIVSRSQMTSFTRLGRCSFEEVQN